VLLGMQLPAIARAVPPELSTRHRVIEPFLIVMSLTLCLMALRYLFLLIARGIRRISSGRHGQRQAFTARMDVTATVAGVRGAVTLAGVLSLPLLMADGSAFPARQTVIFLASGVIVWWLVIAWVALPSLARPLAGDSHRAATLEIRSARI